MPLIRLGQSSFGGEPLPVPATRLSTIPLRLGLSQLGTSLKKYRTTVRLSRYVLGGGGLTLIDPTLAYLDTITATTSVLILPEVNGVAEIYTGQLADVFPGHTQLGKSFALGYGGIIKTTYGDTGDISIDGDVSVEITATELVDLSGDTFYRLNFIGTLTPILYPVPITSSIIRRSNNEYWNGDPHIPKPSLNYAPWNGRRLNTWSAIRPLQNTEEMPEWNVPAVPGGLFTQYQLLDSVSSITGSDISDVFSIVGGNLAPYGIATQSSVFFTTSGYPRAAHDLNTSTYQHTNTQSHPWWQIDLLSVCDIDNIVVWNRPDAFQSRLSDFYVFVSDNPMTTSEDISDLLARGDVWNNHQTTYPNLSVDISTGGITGRYVRVQQNSTDYMHIAEVEIIGDGDIPFRSGATMSLFRHHRKKAVYRSPGALVQADFEMDGATDVSVAGSSLFLSGVTADGTSSCAITGIHSIAGLINADGVVDVSINAEQVYEGTLDITGQTDVEITDTSYLDEGWQADGVGTCEIDGQWVGGGVFDITGQTDFEMDGNEANGRIEIEGITDVAIDSNVNYADNFFTMDGVTDFSINAAKQYAASLTMDGVADIAFANTILVANASITMDGATNWVVDAVADYTNYFNMDGIADVAISASFQPSVTIVCTGVGDLFYEGEVEAVGGWNADGTTNVSFTGNLQAVGLLEWYTGIRTDVAISGKKDVDAYINMDGSVDVYIDVAQDVFGEVIFDQIEQGLSALGTFEYEGSIVPIAISTLTVNGKHIPLGTDYVWGIVDNTQTTGASTGLDDSFTTSSKTARGPIPSPFGRMNKKFAYGFSRPASSFLRKPLRDNTSLEWVRFNFFVDNALDFTGIDDTIGFTASGITSIGSSTLAGRIKEEYVTFSVLTTARSTQQTLEILASGDPPVDVTQVCYEMLWIPEASAFNTQTAMEVLYLANLAAIKQVAVETVGIIPSSLVVQQVAIEMMHSVKAATQVTQITEEILNGGGDPSVQMTAANLEILTREQVALFAAAIVSQVGTETLHDGDPTTSVIHSSLEAMHNSDPKARHIHESVETMHNNDRNARTNHVAIEEIGNSITQSACVNHIAVEILVKSEVDPTVASLVNNPRYHI